MKVILTTNNIEDLIFEYRGLKVMVDVDLAILYGTETKKLKQSVKRNIQRFPNDFMFELTKEEKQSLIENVPRLASMKHSTVLPMVFTEQGVAMLSSVIRSPQAIQVNIEIMRSFSRYRRLILDNEELWKEIKKLDKTLHKALRLLLEKIDKLGTKPK